MTRKRKLTHSQERKLIAELAAIFEKHYEEFLKCKDVPPERMLTSRADLHVFMMLDRMVPGSNDIVSAANHDEIFLSIEPVDLMQAASEEDIVDMIRCGLRFDRDNESLCMFV